LGAESLGESRKPSRELSIGEIFTRTFTLYRENFAQFLLPFLIAGAIEGAILVTLRSLITVPATLPLTATPQELLHWLPGYLSAILAIAFFTGITGWIIGNIAQGIAVKFTSDTLENGTANLMASFNFTVSRLLSLLAVSIITGILILLGLTALVIPGIILAMLFSLVVPVIMIENKGALESLSRSRLLVDRRWLKTFGSLLLFGIIIGVVSSILTVLVGSLGLVGSVASSILVAFIQPILPIGLTLYYYSMIARATPATTSQPAQTI
jgi:hypothetical protein